MKVWQLAIDLAERSYDLTRDFPRDEMFGLTSQIRRSSVSIAANIAEGHGRQTTNAFVQFLRIAQGSLKELETLLIIATRTRTADHGAVAPLLDSADELGRMLRGLIRSLLAKTEA